MLKEAIEKHQKTPTSRTPTFYIFSYVMDVFCATFPILAMGWNWTRIGPLAHIYCSPSWEDNFIPIIYDICDHFMGSIYHNLLNEDASTF